MRWLILVIALSLGTGCAHKKTSPEALDLAVASAQAEAADSPLEEPETNDNILAAGFLLRLRHAEDRDLNGTFRIGFNGIVDLPYNVSLKASGLTLEEFQAAVAKAYLPFFKSGFRVGVELVERAYWIEVRGLVVKPGRLRIKKETSVDEVIALAGGFPTTAENQPRFLKVAREGKARLLNLEEYFSMGTLRTGIKWQGSEVLFFQKESSGDTISSLGSKVQLLGEVRRPGEFGFRQGKDIYFYLAEAGGPTRDSDFQKVEIYRGDAGKRTLVEFELDDPKNAPSVQPGDIIVVHADKLSPFQKFLNSAASFATVVSAIALLIIAL